MDEPIDLPPEDNLPTSALSGIPMDGREISVARAWRYVWPSAKRSIGSKPGVFEVPAVALLALGAIGVTVGIWEQPTGTLIGRNIWFRLGVVLAILGLVVALAVPIITIIEGSRRMRFLHMLENRSIEGHQLSRRVKDLAKEKPEVIEEEWPKLQVDAVAWATRVTQTLKQREPTLRGYFVLEAGFTQKDFRTGHKDLERLAHFLDELRTRLGDIIMKVG
jgi:hypothetical protein